MTKKLGFSFIELLLYVALITMVMSAIVPFTLNLTSNGAKLRVKNDTTANAQFIVQLLEHEIEKCTSIDTAVSDFGANLVLNSANSLQLNCTAPDSPLVINISSGNLQIKKGSGATTVANSSTIKITDLTFYNNSYGDNSARNISYTITISSNSTSTRQEFVDSFSIVSAIDLHGTLP